MANETNVLGVLEFYSKDQFSKIQTELQKLGDKNLFNIVTNGEHINNRGSILIPFAKIIRAEMDDEDFLISKLKELISIFSFVSMFCIQVYIDYYNRGVIRYTLLFSEGELSIQKHKCEFSQ